MQLRSPLKAWTLTKGKWGTAELGANTVSKQTNELCFLRQKLPSPTVIDQSKCLGIFGLAQHIVLALVNKWKRLCRLPLWVYVKEGSSLRQKKRIISLALKI